MGTFKVTLEVPEAFDFGGPFKADGLTLFSPGVRSIKGWKPETYVDCILHGMKQRCRDATTWNKDKAEVNLKKYGSRAKYTEAMFNETYTSLVKGEWDRRGPRIDMFAVECRSKVLKNLMGDKRCKAFAGKDRESKYQAIEWSGDRADVIASLTKVVGVEAARWFTAQADEVVKARLAEGEGIEGL